MVPHPSGCGLWECSDASELSVVSTDELRESSTLYDVILSLSKIEAITARSVPSAVILSGSKEHG